MRSELEVPVIAGPSLQLSAEANRGLKPVSSMASRSACGKVERWQSSKSWLRRRVEGALVGGFTRAYETVRVDPAKFLAAAAGSVSDADQRVSRGVFARHRRVDAVADSIIRSGMKVAAVEGAGFGLGGLITIVPDLGILSAITMRTIQKLSLVYGFEFNTDDEIAELWIAAASAAGVDISRELVEKEVVNKFVPRVIQRIAAKASAEVVEKWAGRVIPLASSRDWRGTELLVRAGLGRTGQGAFSRAAFGGAAAGGAGGSGDAWSGDASEERELGWLFRNLFAGLSSSASEGSGQITRNEAPPAECRGPSLRPG